MVVVIGGGAAGMIAAGISAQKGNKVCLLEKNNKLGKKLYITGKGRCNLTNYSDIEYIISKIPTNPFFLYSALYNFDSKSTMDFFESLGVPLKIERGNRVFPKSDKSQDIIDALKRFLIKNNVEIHYDETVNNLIVQDNKLIGISTKENSKFYCDKAIIATGGLSYPSTGSTGDGYRLAKSVGHTITKLYPSLVPLVVEENWCSKLQGLSLKNIAITVKDNKRILFKDFGELMFTHFGLSGPVILSASRNIVQNIDNNILVIIDLKPALDEKTLDNRLLKDFDKFKNKLFKNSLDELLPQKLIPVIIDLSNIDKEKKVNEITKAERKSLIKLIKNFTFHINGYRGYNEAIITMGGVNTDEIEPTTMESKILHGLFFAGEIINVDAYTGGYNLQIAFSTGYTAGINT